MAVQAHELRIGNKVFPANNDNVLTIEEIKWKSIRVNYIRLDTNQPHVSLIPFEDANPIPLTPEILEKAGFVLNKDIYRWHNRGITICNNEDDTGFYWDLSNNNGYKLLTEWKDISHLHQLQNLYFALTGEELQINL
jgi:hypothetical protein